MATRIELRATASQRAREVIVQQDYNAVAVSVNRAVSQGELFLPLTGADGKGITINAALVEDIGEV